MKPGKTIYKFKSLRENFDHTADILINNRFYAALPSELNDPMEGLYELADLHSNNSRRLSTKTQRVCSFSKNHKEPLLWAYYADGFRGICIAATFKGNGFARAEEVEYVPTRPVFFEQISNDIDAIEALSLKWPDWEHEGEVRLFTDPDHPYIDTELEISEIYFGTRTSDLHKQLIKRLFPAERCFETEIDFKNGAKVKVLR
jgi:hypothetical protein